MKKNSAILAINLLAIPLFLSGLYAGNLTPPSGTPSPTMKSLDEIEPRTPLDPRVSGGLTIDTPGHYFLSHPLNAESETLEITSDNVILDLSGLLHVSGSILIDDVTNVTVKNGSMQTSNLAIATNATVLLESIDFLASPCTITDGSEAQINKCRFLGDSTTLNQDAISLQDSSIQMESFHISGYSYGIHSLGLVDQDRISLRDGLFLNNTTSIAAIGDGAIQVEKVQFQGNANSLIGVQIGDSSLTLSNTSFRDIPTITTLTNKNAQLTIKNSKIARFLSLIDFQVAPSALAYAQLSNCTVDGINDDVGPSKLVNNHSEQSIRVSLNSCVINGLEEFSNTDALTRLDIEKSVLENVDTLVFASNSTVKDSTIRISSGINAFSITAGSVFEGTTIQSNSAPYTGTITLGEGVLIDGCRILDIGNGFTLTDDSAIIRNSQITHRGGSAQTAITNQGSSGDREAALIENTTISGYDTALQDGEYHAQKLTIQNCKKAFDVEDLQLSASTIFADDLGSISGMAVLSDSTFRTTNIGLVTQKCDIRNCTFTNQDEGSGTALVINIGGNVSKSTFSYFGTSISGNHLNVRDCAFFEGVTGINAQQASSIHNNTFLSFDQAVTTSSGSSVITQNQVSNGSNGIESDSYSIIRQNHLAVTGDAISGTGVIVQNATTQGSYQIQGTTGVIVDDTTVNASADNMHPAQPWANLKQ